MTAKILTQERLKELLHYDPETGVLIRIAPVAGRKGKAGDVVGTLDANGYLRIMLAGKRYQAHRLAWLYMTGEWPKEHTDHINHIRNDNQWVNLREVSRLENGRNLSLYKNNASGITGVYWLNQSKKWTVKIRSKGELISLGCFETLFDASSARKSAELKYGFHENHGS